LTTVGQVGATVATVVAVWPVMAIILSISRMGRRWGTRVSISRLSIDHTHNRIVWMSVQSVLRNIKDQVVDLLLIYAATPNMAFDDVVTSIILFKKTVNDNLVQQ
jgi:predicted oxidoreductase